MTTVLLAETDDNPRARETRARALFVNGREHEQRGRIDEAIADYTAAIAAANVESDARILAEALRRLAMQRRRRNEFDAAVELCTQSHVVASGIPDPALAAEALNGLALVYFTRGDWEAARRELLRALQCEAPCDRLRGGIEQNLGVMANAEGDLETALAHYERSLQRFRTAQDQRSCAIALHNIGMNKADRALWDEAALSFGNSLEIAESIGDDYLRGKVLLNRSEVHIARQEYELAKQSAEASLQIFDKMGARDLKAEAYIFLGMLYRETGRPLLAEARLKSSVEIATEVGAVLVQAEATRELAVLYSQLGRNQETLKLLSTAHRLFGRLNARRDLVDVSSKVAQLERIYLDIVRGWGSSIETADTYTFGHSERVARYAVDVATAFGLADSEITAVRVGAYLHDVGKIRVPHEILSKPGRLTPDEFELMKLHPIYGIELLASVDFPWDIKPIVRSHHERIDGTGYPDGLRGDEIPLNAQIICIADVYDALTSNRSYRGALPHGDAMNIMLESRHWWWPEVFDAFTAGCDIASAA